MSNKCITVVSAEQYDSEFPSSRLGEFAGWLKTHVESIPKEFRDCAKIEIDAYEEYDSVYSRIEISYIRPETKEEESQREQKQANQERDRVVKELATLKRLKAKYEP